MKLLTTAIMLPAMIAITFSGGVQSADVFFKNVCGNVQSDNKSRLRNQLKVNKVRLKNIYDGTTCNGDSLLRFAMNSSSDNVGVFMVKRLPASLLKGAEADGKTVYQWAQDNGKADSVIGQAIKTRAKL